jgi:hypothetical protein
MRPDRPAERDVPEGFELVAAPNDRWRVSSSADWKRCRYGAGYHSKACGEPAVAELNRSHWHRENWWAYCGDHLYGGWIEDGTVMNWILRKIQNVTS